MTTILLTGATGQVGWELARTLTPLGTLTIPERNGCDFARPDSLGPLVDRARPDVIVNAAAYTAVDKAEEEPGLAMTINAESAGALALAARRHGALMVHYSTDYVFDGLEDAPYAEDDIARPISAYGRSKLAGEQAVRASDCDHLIFRTSWVFSARGRNFLKTILRLACEREQLRVVGDQFGAPTWARLIAEVTSLALHREIAHRKSGKFEGGTFHLTAAGETSWHGFASAIVEEARKLGAAVKARDVVSISTAEYPSPAARPPNSRLAGVKLARHFGLEMPGWETCMRLCLAELLTHPLHA